jgi:hypothetical protein
MEHLKIPLLEDAPLVNQAVKLPPFWTTNYILLWDQGQDMPRPLHLVGN